MVERKRPLTSNYVCKVIKVMCLIKIGEITPYQLSLFRHLSICICIYLYVTYVELHKLLFICGSFSSGVKYDI